MEKPCDFLLGASDPEVTDRLKSLVETPAGVLDRRFTQEEDFFLALERPVTVEPFEIHHSVQTMTPSERYLRGLRSLVRAWTAQVPEVFRGLSWFFDPRDLFHPLFLQILSSKEKRYLFVLRPDLTFRNRHGEVLDRGGNDVTPRYQTQALFVEAEVLPLTTWETLPDHKRLYLAKIFEATWKGESGRGYFVTGRWIDQEITKLVSRASLPTGARTFPHYPLRCRYETLSVRCPTPTVEGRRKAAAALEEAWPLVSPWAAKIQADLKVDPYRDDHPLIEQLRQQWGGRLARRWGDYRLEPYLNENDQKEYRYHGD